MTCNTCNNRLFFFKITDAFYPHARIRSFTKSCRSGLRFGTDKLGTRIAERSSDWLTVRQKRSFKSLRRRDFCFDSNQYGLHYQPLNHFIWFSSLTCQKVVLKWRSRWELRRRRRMKSVGSSSCCHTPGPTAETHTHTFKNTKCIVNHQFI